MTMQAQIVLRLFAVLLVLSSVASQTSNQYCNDDMTACSCPESDDVCYFEFAVQRLITFTRYVRDTPQGSAGKSYFINDLGELEHVPFSPDLTGCNATNCTQANTADGLTYRTFVGINGRLPGPTLVVYDGQTVVVNVVNMLRTESTTIHWHGITQVNTPWMDGTDTITQCPIAPGTSFRYIFKPSQAGTFWYHSHSGFQRADGMSGGLVVKDRSVTAERYPIHHIDNPEEHTVILMDWQREEATTAFWKGLSKLRRENSPSILIDSVPLHGDFVFGSAGVDGTGIGTVQFWSALINGLGKHRELNYNNSRLKVFSVQSGNTYRFRLVGASGLFGFRFSIDGHRLTVIATDGNYIQPVEADYVIIQAGERYDVLVTANQTGQSDFWIRTETLEAQVNFFINPIPLPPYDPLPGHEGRAILHYDGTNPIPMGPEYSSITEIPKFCTTESPCKVVNCPFQNYHPTFNINCVNVYQLRLFFPTTPELIPSADYDEQYFLNFAFEGQRRLASINTRTFVSPPMSPLIDPTSLDTSTLCDPNDDCKDGCFCTNKIDIPFNKTIRFVLSSAGRRRINRRFAHPIHLHGHHFHVVATGYGSYNETTGESISPTSDIECGPGSSNRVCIKPDWKAGAEPQVTLDEFTIVKDTVMLPGLGYVIIHFRSTNPGWWLLHCHMAPHQSEGMVLVINEAEERQPPPPDGICNRGNFFWTVEEFNKALQFEYVPPSTRVPSTSSTHTSVPSSTSTLTTQIPSPTSTSMPRTGSDDGEDDGLAKNAIAGIAIGVVLFVTFCIAVVLVVAIVLVATKNKGVEKSRQKGGIRASEDDPSIVIGRNEATEMTVQENEPQQNDREETNPKEVN